mmetsp:Transcript_17820/g.56990  ORF Transcript_17820/g.56990 Transcript_17820/m.56990 type:complete len:156 (+) Transcript_17820:622-1089(+)
MSRTTSESSRGSRLGRTRTPLSRTPASWGGWRARVKVATTVNQSQSAAPPRRRATTRVAAIAAAATATATATARGAMAAAGGKQTPSDFLKQVIGRPVIVKLNSGVDYRGVLACLDGFMNIALEQTEEYVNGVKTNSYGDSFIRGNNVLYISRTD